MFDNSFSNTLISLENMGFVPFISFKNSQGTPICTPLIENAKTPKFKEQQTFFSEEESVSEAPQTVFMIADEWHLDNWDMFIS